MKNKSLAILFILFSVLCALFVNTSSTNIKTIDEQTRIIDSLNSEVFMKDIQIGRYQIIMDNLYERYPDVYDTVKQNVE